MTRSGGKTPLFANAESRKRENIAEIRALLEMKYNVNDIVRKTKLDFNLVYDLINQIKK